MARAGKRSQTQGQLRIIGGQWRGRKLRFTPEDGLRPTPDRIRETLFNWLAPVINNARCVDLFTGSGALGLEALSRGASFCDFVDTSSSVGRQVDDHVQTLLAQDRAACHRMSATAFLQQARTPFDIVFLDPPFAQGLVAPACELLTSQSLLSGEAMVYIETAASEPPPEVPASWQLHREKASGGVAYRLYQAQ